jgi:CRP/FNR family transcriptional regulator
MANKNAGKVLLARSGPALRAANLWLGDNPSRVHQLLSKAEQARLSVIASIVRFDKGQQIYRAGEPVDAIYDLIFGVVKAYSTEPDGSEIIYAFLFADDLLGLSEEGRYTNSAEAITPVAAYRLPVTKLHDHLSRDAKLEFHVICKLCQELRQAQRHAFLISRRDAVPKIAMFLQLIEELQANREEATNEIHLPMDRTEIGEYVGLSLAAVSRAFRRLAQDGVIEVRNRRHIKVKDRNAFNTLAGLSSRMCR